MALDLAGLILPIGTAVVGAAAGWFAPKYRRDEVKIQADLTREQSAQAYQDKFHLQIMERLEKSEAKSEAKIDGLQTQVNAQALEIATLTGKVQVLEHSENALKLEVLRLKGELARAKTERDAEVARLQSEKDALDFENQTQAQELARLNGRITELTTQLAAVTQAAAALASGGTTP